MTSTVVADVGLTECCTQMETNSYPGCVIDHPFAGLEKRQEGHATRPQTLSWLLPVT